MPHQLSGLQVYIPLHVTGTQLAPVMSGTPCMPDPNVMLCKIPSASQGAACASAGSTSLQAQAAPLYVPARSLLPAKALTVFLTQEVMQGGLLTDGQPSHQQPVPQGYSTLVCQQGPSVQGSCPRVGGLVPHPLSQHVKQRLLGPQPAGLPLTACACATSARPPDDESAEWGA